MWDRRERARFAPAESPVRIMFPGGILRLLRTWFRSIDACWSCLGYGAPGARSEICVNEVGGEEKGDVRITV